MKSKLLFGAIATFGLFAASAAEAQRQAPYDLWCRDQPVGYAGAVQICMAYTYQQCMASRASHVESCYLNPRYDPRFRR